ncbi:MAG: hypothetical protein RLN99_04535, partial [Kiloniellaceae bacterium]
RAFQVSLLAYAVSGAALNMAYFEMYYVLIILISIQETLVAQYKQAQAAGGTPAPGAPDTAASGPGSQPAPRPGYGGPQRPAHRPARRPATARFTGRRP